MLHQRGTSAHAQHVGRVFSQRESFYQTSEDFGRFEIQNNVKSKRKTLYYRYVRI
jgi:hypothetical protein